jgi:hypothetical protein
MALPDSVMHHHTAWIHCSDCPPHPVRYAVDADRLVVFGDDLPAGATNGRQLFVTVHEIAAGPALAEMNLTRRRTRRARSELSTRASRTRLAGPHRRRSRCGDRPAPPPPCRHALQLTMTDDRSSTEAGGTWVGARRCPYACALIRGSASVRANAIAGPWAPNVYPLDDEDHVAVHMMEVPSELADDARWGTSVCPERAITVIGPPEAYWFERLRHRHEQTSRRTTEGKEQQ